MRKGQVLSQVFILILAGAVFIMILLYGYSAIKLFNERGRQICMIDFSNKLQSAVKTIAIDAGSVDTLSLDPCEGFTEVCFVDADNLLAFGSNAGKAHPLIRNLAESRTQNIFFFPPSDFSFFVPNMQVRKGGFCKQLTGKLSLRLEGLGNRAVVSESGFEEAEENAIEITDSGFTSDTMNIRRGETVTFVNHDPNDQVHIVIFDNPSIGSVSLQPTESGDITFDRSGSFRYHDRDKPSNTGIIKVQ